MLETLTRWLIVFTLAAIMGLLDARDARAHPGGNHCHRATTCGGR